MMVSTGEPAGEPAGEEKTGGVANFGLLPLPWGMDESGCEAPMTMSSLESFRVEGLRDMLLLE